MQNNMNQTSDKTTGSTTGSNKGSNGKWAAQAQKGAEENIETMTDTARKIYDQAVEVGTEFITEANKKATSVVKEYPMYATLGGLCVGFLIGASLFGRRASKEG